MVIHMRVVVDVARGVAKKLIEAALRRAAPFSEPDVPFAKTGGRVTCGLEKLREEPFAMTQADAFQVLSGAKLMVQAVALRMAAREQRRPGGRAGGRGYVEIG